VLEYLHVPHDLPLAPKHQLLLAQAKVKDKDLDEGTPDHPGEPLETAEVNEAAKSDVAQTNAAQASSPATADGGTNVVQAAVRQSLASVPFGNQSNKSEAAQSEPKLPTSGTVILEVEQGGIEVPSFVGKTFRGAVEAAEDSGLALEAVGSGVAREQSPAAGTHVPAGARVTVQFGR
jgi:cell division protein FtsI (penicillin-binding protein 3)